MSNELNTSKKPGRPSKTITWPDNLFSIEQLQVKTQLSKVTLYLKVNQALANGTITKAGKEKTNQGRPRDLFRKTSTQAIMSDPLIVTGTAGDVVSIPVPA